jgi:hypothetical protein
MHAHALACLEPGLRKPITFQPNTGENSAMPWVTKAFNLKSAPNAWVRGDAGPKATISGRVSWNVHDASIKRIGMWAKK